MAAGLEDPATSIYVTRHGGLMPELTGIKVMPIQLKRGLNQADPSTGKSLRKRVNQARRKLRGAWVSNRCRGWDATLSLDKSVSIAALVFEDPIVRNLAYQALIAAGRWLARKIMRRIRKGGANHEVFTGLGIVFAIPEKASRHRDPHIHVHHVFCNVTAHSEEGQTRHTAASFQQVAAWTGEASRRANVRLFRQLAMRGYHVELHRGRTCRLVAVPRYLCRQLSKSAKAMERAGESDTRRTAPSVASVKVARRRLKAYKRIRPAKEYRSLVEWQEVWAAQIGPLELKNLRNDYYADRYWRVASLPTKSPDAATLPAATAKALAGSKKFLARPTTRALAEEITESQDEFTSFDNLTTAFHKQLSEECREPIMWGKLEVKHEYVFHEAEADRKLPAEATLLRDLLRALLPSLRQRAEPSVGTQPKLTLTAGAQGQENLGKIVKQLGEAYHVEFTQLLKSMPLDSIRFHIRQVVPASLRTAPPEELGFMMTVEPARPDQGTTDLMHADVRSTNALPAEPDTAIEHLEIIS